MNIFKKIITVTSWRKVAFSIVLFFVLLSAVSTLALGFAYLNNVPSAVMIRKIPAPIRKVVKTIAKDIQKIPYFLWTFKKYPLLTYNVTIDPDDWRKLNDEKLLLGADLPKESKKAKPAEFRAGNETMKVRVQYRGDTSPHFLYFKKSWRIEFVEPEIFEGMRYVDLIVPQDRSFVTEQLNNYRAKKLGLVVPESRFVRLKVNGQDFGVYFMVEHWSKEFLEKNRLSGDTNFYKERSVNEPIFEDIRYWNKVTTNPQETISNYAELQTLIDIINKTSDNEFLQKISTIVDMDNFMRWYMHSLLSGSDHQDWAHNIRLYFDPALGKFQFIPWDVEIARLADWNGIDIHYNPLISRLLANPEFVLKRNQVLWEYVKDDKNLEDDLAFYDRVFNEVRGAFYQDRATEYSPQYFDRSSAEYRALIKENFEYIKDYLQRAKAEVRLTLNAPTTAAPLTVDVLAANPSALQLHEIQVGEERASARGWSVFYDANGDGVFSGADRFLTQAGYGNATSTTRLPIEMTLFSRFEKTVDNVRQYAPFRIVPRQYRFFLVPFSAQNSPLADVSVAVEMTNLVTGEDVKTDTAVLDYSALATLDRIIESPSSFVRRHPAFFLGNNGAVTLPAGTWAFPDTVIVPKNTKLEIQAGATLLFGKGASLISYSPVRVSGTPAAPIRVSSLTPGIPWGVFGIVDPGGPSEFAYVIFERGGSARVNGSYFSGMLAIYRSDVTIRDSQFRFATGDDALNIKNSLIDVHNNIFEKNSFDGFDNDFTTGEIIGNRFLNNGNDGIDVSGSDILVKDNFISGSGDKGISVGEASKTTIVNTVVVGSTVGIASKDSSLARILHSVLVGNKTGVAAYQKKPIFDGGEIHLTNSIVWGNEKFVDMDALSKINMTWSALQDEYAGEGNIVKEPQFLDAVHGDYRLEMSSADVFWGDIASTKDVLKIDQDRVMMGLLQ